MAFGLRVIYRRKWRTTTTSRALTTTSRRFADEKKPNDKLLDNFQPSKMTGTEMMSNAKSLYNTMSKQVTDFYNEKMASNGSRQVVKDGEEWYSAKVSFWMKRYENFVGLTDVKGAQVRVVQTEKQFIISQDNRRETQRTINEVQQKIKSLHSEIERTYRGEDKYLELVTLEHQVLKEEKALMDTLVVQEREEREAFSRLSRAVRDSHESERAQAEKTKYW